MYIAMIDEYALAWPAGGSGRIPLWRTPTAASTSASSSGSSMARTGRTSLSKPRSRTLAITSSRESANAPSSSSANADGEVSALENRCAHHASKVCAANFGTVKELICPYHQWSYDLKGDLVGVPFRRGVKKQGGMPADFDPKNLSLNKLQVAVRNGVIFASFDSQVESFEEYLGPRMLHYFDRLFDGRKLSIHGYSRQRIPATGS